MKLNLEKFKEIKTYILKEKYILVLSTLSYFLIENSTKLKKDMLVYYLGIIGLGMITLIIFDKIGEKYKKKENLIMLLTFLGIGLVSLIKVNLDIYIKIIFGINSFLLYIWISLGSKEIKTTIKRYCQLLVQSICYLAIFNLILMAIIFLLNSVSKTLLGIQLKPVTIFAAINSYYIIFFNYIYNNFKENYTNGKEGKKEKKIILGLLDLQNIGILIIFIYIIKIIYFKEFPKNTLGRLIPLFFIFAIIKLFLVTNYKKLKLEKLIWYSSPILLFYYFNSYYKRVSEYGLTEKRFLMITFGVFLLLTSVFYFFIKNQDKKLKSILLTFLIFINFNLYFNNIISKKYVKEIKKNERQIIKTRGIRVEFTKELNVFKNSKIYFKNKIKIKENLFIKKSSWNIEIIKDSKIVFSSDKMLYFYNKKNQELKEDTEKLFKNGTVKIIYNGEELFYSQFIEKMYSLAENSQENILKLNKEVYYKITLDGKIIIIPIRNLFFNLKEIPKNEKKTTEEKLKELRDITLENITIIYEN